MSIIYLNTEEKYQVLNYLGPELTQNRVTLKSQCLVVI